MQVCIVRPFALRLSVSKSKYARKPKPGSPRNHAQDYMKGHRNKHRQLDHASHPQQPANGIICQLHGFDYHIMECVLRKERLAKNGITLKKYSKKETGKQTGLTCSTCLQQLTGDSSKDEYVWVVDSWSTKGQNKGKSPMTMIAVNDIKVRMMVDTGASVNMMDEQLYDTIQKPML